VGVRTFRGKWLVVTLAVAGVMLFLTMPRSLYPGDRNASRIQAILLLTRGEMGLPYAERETLGGFLEMRGQYFFENDAKQRFYSKYGMGYTLFQLPPLFIEKLNSGDLPMMGGSESLVFILNVYHIVLALIAAAYLYGLAGMVTRRGWLRMLFVLATYFCTFTWNYLRAPAHEILQLVPFVAVYYHMMRFLQARADGQEGFRACWMHLLVATVFVVILVQMKTFFVMSAAVVAFAALLAAGGARSPSEPGKTGSWIASWASRLRLNLTRHWFRYVLYMGIPALLGIGSLLLFNTIRFGSPLEAGYSQWAPGGEKMIMFKLSRFPEAVAGYFFGTGNHSVWLHNPLFLFALLGFWRFFRRLQACRMFFFLALGLNVAAVCFYVTWGDWCYGPRHMMLWAMIGALPVVAFVDWLLDTAAKPLRWTVAAGIVCMLAWSLQMQMNMNAIHYFAFYYLEPVFQQFKQDRIHRYFNDTIHRGFIHADIMAHNQGKRTFPPVAMMMPLIQPGYQARFKAQMDGMLKQLGTSNYYFFE
jgi:hypothetical protein